MDPDVTKWLVLTSHTNLEKIHLCFHQLCTEAVLMFPTTFTYCFLRCQELHVVPFCNFCWLFPVLSVMFWLDDKNGSRCPEVRRVHLYVTSHLGQEGSNAELQKVTNLNMNAHVCTDQPSVFTLNIWHAALMHFKTQEHQHWKIIGWLQSWFLHKLCNKQNYRYRNKWKSTLHANV